MFGYSLNYLMDMENAVVIDIEATETMIERVKERFGPNPNRIAGDVAGTKITSAFGV